MKRCKVTFSGLSGEIYEDVIDGDQASVEQEIKRIMQVGLFHVRKSFERNSETIWTLRPQAIESLCIEEFEEEEE